MIPPLLYKAGSLIRFRLFKRSPSHSGPLYLRAQKSLGGRLWTPYPPNLYDEIHNSLQQTNIEIQKTFEKASKEPETALKGNQLFNGKDYL